MSETRLTPARRAELGALCKALAAKEQELAQMKGWLHTTFDSAQPDGSLLCPACDQSEAKGHAPDCCARLWMREHFVGLTGEAQP